MRTPWVLGPGAVWAGRDINGPVTVVLNTRADDPVAAAIPSPVHLARLYEVLDLARFTGRERLIDDIAKATTAGGRGYVVVRAEAGCGKTALAAELARRYPCACHFTWLPQGRSPEHARRSLAAQLIQTWQVGGELLVPYGQFPARADEPAWFLDVVTAAAARRNERYPQEPRPPLVLVVDGLDEAEPPTPGRDTGIPVGLPRPEHLPDGVFIVATTRFGTNLTQLRNFAYWQTIPVVGADNLGDMRWFLADAIAGPHADQRLRGALDSRGVNGEEFLDTMVERCGGVWIYLRYVLDEIRAGRRDPTDVATLPSGLIGYYLEQVQRWRRATDSWYRTGLPLLATLVAVRKPLSRAELVVFTDQTEDALRPWLDEQLPAFLDISRDDRNRYAIRHQSLRDLFAPCADPDDPDASTRDSLAEALDRAQVRVTNVLMRQVPDPSAAAPFDDDLVVDEYLHAELAGHAAAAGMLNALATDPLFLLACDPNSLLRIRHLFTDAEARAALSAYELSAGRRSVAGPRNALWWLHVWARKTGCRTLAERCAPSEGPAIRAAFWAGVSHLRLMHKDSPVLAVCAVALPDGRDLLTAGGPYGQLVQWDTGTTPSYLNVSSLAHSHEPVTALCAVTTENGTLVACPGEDNTVLLLDATTGEPVGRPLTGHQRPVTAMSTITEPSGRTLLATVSERDYTARLWDPARGTQIGQPYLARTTHVHVEFGVREPTVQQPTYSRLTSVCLLPSPHGHTLLAYAGDEGSAYLWDLDTGKPFGLASTGSPDAVTAMCAVPLPDGRTLLAMAGIDGAVRLWDPGTQARVGEPLAGHSRQVNALCTVSMPDGRTLLASASADSTIRLWEPSSGKPVGDPLVGHEDVVTSVCALTLPDGRTVLASSSVDHTVRLWDLGAARETNVGHHARVTGMCAVPLPGGNSRLATVDTNATILCWNPVAGMPVGNPMNGDRPVTAMCTVPRPDGRTWLATASMGDPATIRLWDLDRGGPAGEPVPTHFRGITAVCAVPLPNGRTIVAAAGESSLTGADATIRLYELDSGALVNYPLTGHQHRVTALCAIPLPSGQTAVASASWDRTVRLWNWVTGRPIVEPIAAHADPVLTLCALPMPDGRTLLVSGSQDWSIRMWDPTTGTQVGKAFGEQVWVTAVCAVPLANGRVLLGSGSMDGYIMLVDPVTGENLGYGRTAHDATITHMCAVPQAGGPDLFATAGTDRTILVWELPPIA